MRGFWCALAVSAVLAVTPVYAVGLSDPVNMKLSEIQTVIEKGEPQKAIEMLWQYLDSNPDDADGYNLLGYSYRKDRKFDLAKKSYDRALAIEPEHKGAHEYLGELYLQTGQPDKAEAQLEKLAQICGLEGCEEYEELRVAIADFKRGKSTKKW